ncbi:MAG: hypothetical protein ACE5F1_18965, partial [Planctomycetota bacterium]
MANPVRPLFRALLNRCPGAACFICHLLFWVGYRRFKRSGKTPGSSHRSLRRLHSLTNGAFNRRMSARISTGTELRPFSLNGAAPAASPWLEEEHASALAALRKEGCYVFRERLCEEKCEALLRLAETNPARLIPERRDLAPRMEFEPRHLQAPRYQFDEGLLVESRLVQELIANTSFLHLA